LLQIIFSKINNVKLKQDIFIDPQIRKLMLDDQFENKMNKIERIVFEEKKC